MLADTYKLFNYCIEPTFCGESVSLDLTPNSISCIKTNIIVSTEYTISLWGQVRTGSLLPLSNACIQVLSLRIAAPPYTCHCLSESSSDGNGVYNCQFIGSDAFYYFLVISTPTPDNCKIFPVPLPNIDLSSDEMYPYYNALLHHLSPSFNISSFISPRSTHQLSISYFLPTYT